MVITVTCPSCSSSFPVDPAKIPEGGVNARCTLCADIFRVEKPAGDPPDPLLDLSDLTPLPETAPEPPVHHVDPFDQPATFEAAEPEPALQAAPPPLPEPLPEPAPPPLPEPTRPPASAASRTDAPPTETEVQGFTFGKRDPTDKAKRLDLRCFRPAGRSY